MNEKDAWKIIVQVSTVHSAPIPYEQCSHRLYLQLTSFGCRVYGTDLGFHIVFETQILCILLQKNVGSFFDGDIALGVCRCSVLQN